MTIGKQPEWWEDYGRAVTGEMSPVIGNPTVSTHYPEVRIVSNLNDPAVMSVDTRVRILEVLGDLDSETIQRLMNRIDRLERQIDALNKALQEHLNRPKGNAHESSDFVAAKGLRWDVV